VVSRVSAGLAAVASVLLGLLISVFPGEFKNLIISLLVPLGIPQAQAASDFVAFVFATIIIIVGFVLIYEVARWGARKYGTQTSSPPKKGQVVEPPGAESKPPPTSPLRDFGRMLNEKNQVAVTLRAERDKILAEQVNLGDREEFPATIAYLSSIALGRRSDFDERVGRANELIEVDFAQFLRDRGSAILAHKVKMQNIAHNVIDTMTIPDEPTSALPREQPKSPHEEQGQASQGGELRGDKESQALTLAYKARESLLSASPPVSAILRMCRTISQLLQIDQENRWISLELDGYVREHQSQEQLYQEVPPYRRVRLIFRDDYGNMVPIVDPRLEFIERYPIGNPVGELENNTKGLKVVGGIIRTIQQTTKVPVRYAEISGNYIEAALNGVTNKCLEFVNGVINRYEHS
jgi:hypothetical protein